MIPVLACILGSSSFLAPSIPGDTPEAVFDLVPEEATVIAVVPDLGRTNDDLGQMIDAMNRPGTVLAGRPVELLKARLGVGAGLDERGSLALYLAPAEPGAAEPPWALLLPTASPEAFIDANFPGHEAVAEGVRLFPGEVPTYVRALPRHVLLSDSLELVERHAPSGTLGRTFTGAFDPAVITRSSKADVLLWARGDTLPGLLGDARPPVPIEAPFGGIDPDPALLDALTDGLEESLVVFDFDPLGTSIRTHARYRPGGAADPILSGGPASGAPLSRLPDNPSYFALSADIAGLGGFETFKSIVGLLGLPIEELPTELREGGLGLRQIQLAAYPSRLGIALGGLFNDSSVVVTAEDPAAIEAAFKRTLLELAGERGGIRYDPEWTDDKPLRTGGTSDAFRLKETVLPSRGGAGEGFMRTGAFQRIALQLLYGSRGLSGFAGVEGDAFVLTLSQRPDVWNRALDAATGRAGSLADSPVLRSMRSWLIEEPDMEILIGMGSLTRLMEQLSRAFQVGAFNAEMLPAIPENTPPVVFDLSVDQGRLETALVLPTQVIALGYDEILRQFLQGDEAGQAEAP